MVAVVHFRRHSHSPVWTGALCIPLLYHAGLWAVFCETPVPNAGCGLLYEYMMCSHGCVQPFFCAVVVMSSLPVTSVGRLQVTVLVRCTQSCVFIGKESLLV